MRKLFNLSKLSLTVHCWRIYTVTDGSRTQLSELQSPHCCRNLKQISCTRGVAFFCPAKLDKHCNYSFKFSEGLSAGLWVFLIGMRIFGVYETERILAVAKIEREPTLCRFAFLRNSSFWRNCNSSVFILSWH